MKTFLFVAALLGVSSASPLKSKMLRRQTSWQEGVDCTWDNVGAKPGLLFAVGSDGTNIPCDDIGSASSDQGTKCYSVSADPNVLGDPVKCPADPAPSKNPDGSPAEQVADGLVQTWCDTSPGGLSLQFVNTVGCLTYGYHEANGDVIQEANDGGTAVCDSVFAGACTYFGKVSPVLEDAQNMPCVDEPGENYCDFAGPGK